MMMFDKFRQLADEQTGIPSYSHGMTGTEYDSYCFRDVNVTRYKLFKY